MALIPNSLRLPVGAALVTVALAAGCRPRETAPASFAKAGETIPTMDPDGAVFFCDQESQSRWPASERTQAANALALELLQCAQKNLPLPPLSAEQKLARQGLFDSFITSGCSGCHSGKSSWGGLAQFVANSAAGIEEFSRGIALRHYLTRDLVSKCFAGDAATGQLMKALSSTRIKSEKGLSYVLDKKTYQSLPDIPFFRPGTDLEMRSQVISFLQGGFEIAAGPEDEMHISLLRFIQTGARFDMTTHVCIVRDAMVTLRELKQLRIKN